MIKLSLKLNKLFYYFMSDVKKDINRQNAPFPNIGTRHPIKEIHAVHVPWTIIQEHTHASGLANKQWNWTKKVTKTKEIDACPALPYSFNLNCSWRSATNACARSSASLRVVLRKVRYQNRKNQISRFFYESIPRSS